MDRIKIEVIFLNLLIILIAILMIFTILLENYRKVVNTKCTRIENSILSIELYRFNSFDFTRKFNIENRIFFDAVANDAIKIYKNGITNSNNSEIIEKYNINRKLLERLFYETYKKELSALNFTSIPLEYKKKFVVDTFVVDNNTIERDQKGFITKKGMHLNQSINTPIYEVIFRFPAYITYGYNSYKDFVTRGNIIDSHWVYF